MAQYAWWWIPALLLSGCIIGKYDTDGTRAYFDGTLPKNCGQDSDAKESKLKPVQGGYCIDRTEVTREEYWSWLESEPELNDDFLSELPKRCHYKGKAEPSTRFDPKLRDCWNGVNNSNSNKEHPIVCIDWCDAYAYCKDNGKTLCGTHEGAEVAPGKRNDARSSQWFNACSSGNRYAYPYGDDYERSTCNVEGSGLESANTKYCKTSVGGWAGLYDLIGNAAEWVNSCETSGTEEDRCWVRGGATGDPEKQENLAAEDVNCAYGRSQLVYKASDRTGFRCCWVPPDE